MRSTNISKINIGDLGEDDFAKWCTINGLIYTKAQRDRMGWDFFVEFPANKSAETKIDETADLLKVVVQIKATRSDKKRVNLKLSAAKLLVETDLPAFIIAIQYNNDNTAIAASLIHIGNNEIERILKTAVEHFASGNTELQRSDISLNTTHATSLNVDGSGLSNLLRKHLPASISRYIADKAAFRKQCGYDEKSFKGRFRLSPSASPSEFFDLFLGNTTTVNVSNFIISRTRFGIELESEEIGHGSLSIQPRSFRQATVRATNRHNTYIAETVVSVFSAPFANIPDHLRKIRLKNNFLDIVLDIGSNEADLSVNIGESAHKIDQLANMLKFCYLLGEQDTALQISIDKHVFTVFAKLDAVQDFIWCRVLSDFLERLAVAVYKLKQQIEIEMTISEAYECFSSNLDMFAISSTSGLVINGNIALIANSPDIDNITIITASCINFSIYTYYAIVEIPSKVFTISGDTFFFEGKKAHILCDGLIEQSSTSTNIINELIDRLSKQESNSENVILSISISDALTKT